MNPEFFVDNMRYLMAFRSSTSLMSISGRRGTWR